MTTNEKRSRVPAVPVALTGDQSALAEVARLLVEQARGDGIALTGEGGLLPALVARILQTELNVELEDHLGYEPYAPEGRGSGNSRNGSYAKTVITDVGPVEARCPRPQLELRTGDRPEARPPARRSHRAGRVAVRRA